MFIYVLRVFKTEKNFHIILHKSGVADALKMAHLQYMEELIREYLVFRGFASTLKTFDAELKTDKEKSFRVDKIIEQLMQFISSYDLNGIRELWIHFDNHIFSKLESHFIPSKLSLMAPKRDYQPANNWCRC